MGIRFSGMLQKLELSAYDKMMQVRPQELPDEKFILINITENDLQLPEQKDRQKDTSLSDQALLSLLKKLKQHEPRVIALDLLRSQTDSKYKDLINYLQQDNFIGTCYVGNSQEGFPPPPELSSEQIGYADVFPDPDNIMRRAVLYMNPNPTDRCQAEYSLSFKIAETYLKKEGIESSGTPQKYLQLGETVFKPLDNHTRGYHKLDDRGHQILINYRSVNNSPLNFIPKQNILTLSSALSNEETLKKVKDKIVLIGRNTISSEFTPYYQDKEPMPGVILHAQIASQIINAALGRRPLLDVWSLQTEVLWIWAWSFLGGLFVWGLKRAPVYLGLAVSINLVILYPICYQFFINRSTWVLFVPAAIVFVVTGCCFLYYSELNR